MSGDVGIGVPPQSLKILLYDIETSPGVAFYWRPKVQFINKDMVIHPPFMICWGAKWAHQKQVKSDRLTPEEVSNQDDSRIAESLADLIREADVIVAHNGDKFDEPFLTGRLFTHGLEPLGPTTSIDTLKLSNRDFDLSHNNLEAISKQLGMGRKHKTDFELWEQVYQGSEVAMQKMVRYCRQDVRLLERVFDSMRPYVKRLKRLVDSSGESCPSCGHSHLQKRGYYRTQASTFQRYQCQNEDCMRYFRGRQAIKELKGDLHPL